MKIFNKKFMENKTQVLLIGQPDNNLYVVSEISSDRRLIKVVGLVGSFQRAHVIHFTNKGKLNGLTHTKS